MTDEPALALESYVWNDSGTRPTEGDEIYVAGDQPIAAYDNWAMWAVTTDVANLNDALGNHSHFHEVGGQDELDLDGLGVGKNPAEIVSESTSPASFTFTGTDQRDLHDRTAVTLSNESSSSVTEDVTVELYDGVDATGTVLATETRSVTVGAGASTTETFLADHQKLDAGDYHVEVTLSGSTLAVDQTDEHTLGGRYVRRESTTGDLQFTDHHGTVYAERDAVSGHWTTFPAFNTDVDLQYNSLTNVDDVAVDDVAARNDDLRVRTSGSGSGRVTLRDDDVGQDLARAHEGGEFEVPNGPLSVGGDVRTTGDTTLWDASNGHVPQGRLQNESVTVTAGDGLTGGGSVALGGSTTVDVEPADFAGAGLVDDGSDDLALASDSVTVTAGTGLNGGGTVALGRSVSLDVDDSRYLQRSGDSMNGTLSMSGNDVTGVTRADVGGVTGAESTFQGNSTVAGSGHLNAPWVYASAIEAKTERGGSSTLIEMGADASTTSADEIALVTGGNVNLKVDSNDNVQVSNTLDASSGAVVLPVGTDRWA